MKRMRLAFVLIISIAMLGALAPTVAASTPTPDEVGLFDPGTGQWYLRGADKPFYFGNPADTPFMGDWDGDGVDTPGLFRVSDGFVYLRNSNTQGFADISYFFGDPDDVPLAGDFNGDGHDTVSLYRRSNQTFYISNKLGPNGGALGPADYSFVFGDPGDDPIVGDWDGNGTDTIGTRRPSTGQIYQRNSNSQGVADTSLVFGDPNDGFVSGDWDGNPTDTPGIFRDGKFYLRNSNTSGIADTSFFFGEDGWLPIAGKTPTVSLQVLGFNDYHGHLNADASGKVADVAAGGGEFLSTKLKALRAGHENTVTVAAGDLIGGSPAFSGLFHDEPSIESLNVMGLDVSGVGNHEFDEGVTELLRMQKGGCHPVDGCYFPGTPYAGADFPWLAANVVSKSTGQTPLPPFWIKDIGSVKVGFIGMTLEATSTLVAADGIVGWDFKDEAETANALVPTLKAQGVEAIVVLLHEGGSQTPPPGDVDACVGISGPIVAINAALDPEIDAMITGHTHLPYNCKLNDSAGNPRIVTSAYSYGRVVTELNLVLDTKTGEVRRDLSTAINHVVDNEILTPDPAVTAVINKWQPLFDMSGNIPLGTITADINRGGVGGSDRGVESSAGNLVADAQLWATSSNGAQVAFMNPGGVRSDLTYLQSGTEGDGVVTYGEAFTFQPFGNTLKTFPMTGAQIVDVLEEQCQPLGSSRPFLSLGVSNGFTYDLATTFDSNPDCTAIAITNVKLDGAALVPTSTYMVTVNSFLSTGGDNFGTFNLIDAGLKLEGGVDLEALANYLAAFSPVAPPPITRVNELT